MENNKFKFFCPVGTISKAKDKEGKSVMRIGGIASTSDKDSDGEFLDPAGFDIADFKKSGVVNWHHQSKNSPATIVGEPSKAEIRKNGFYVETDLYPSSPLAKEIYDLAQTMEKDSKTRRLGYSVEGSVVERGSEDKTHPDYKVIKKATITGLAITHMPKNPKTFADIIKGHVDSENEEQPVIIKSKGSKYKIKPLTEDERMDEIFKSYSGISIEKAEQVNFLLNQIQEKMSKMGKLISDEDIEKALSAIGIDSDSNPFIEPIEKGKKSKKDMSPEEIAAAISKQDKDNDEDEEDKKPEKKIKKAKKEVDEDDTDDEEEEEEDKKPIKKSKKEEMKKDDDEDEDDDEVEKSAKPVKNKFKKSKTDDEGIDAIEKSFGSQILTSIEDLGKKQNSDVKSLGILVKAQMDALNKVQEQLVSTNDELKKANDKIDELSGQSQGRKSITKSFVEKQFEKGIDNNFGSGSQQQDANTLSKSRNATQILNLLDKETIAKGSYDEEYVNAVMSFESTKQISSNVIARLKLEKGITIVE